MSIESVVISIHAPVKGATCAVFPSFETIIIYFNPRTREGCDAVVGILHYEHGVISIHAPVKGATRRCVSAGPSFFAFQSTHP